MSDQWGSREQPSERDPGRLRAEHVYLLLGVVSVSAAVVAYILDATLPIELNRGLYAILVAFFVAGYCGWLSRSAERRMRRLAVAELQRMATAVEELRDEVARQGGTLDPEAAAAARRISMRLVNGSDLL